MTDGILLNELQRDRDLRRYDTLIIDEAHERSLNIDFLLGYVKQLLPASPRPEGDHHVRHDRHASVSPSTSPTPTACRRRCSSSRDARTRSRCATARSAPTTPDDPGDRRDQVRAVIDAVDELEREGPGDVLVFLSGEREIHDIADALRDGASPDLEVLPLYARLSAHEQHRIFQAAPRATDRARRRTSRRRRSRCRASGTSSTPEPLGSRDTAAASRCNGCRSSRCRRRRRTSVPAGAVVWLPASASGSTHEDDYDARDRSSPSRRSSGPTWRRSSCR